MEALLLRDAAYVSERYEQLQDSKRHLEQSNVVASTTASCVASPGSEATIDWQEQEHSRILQRAKALEAKGPTPQLNKNFSVLNDILMRLYAEDEHDRHVTSPPNGNLKRHETADANCPVPLKELPQPTQVVLRMFFRTCRSLRGPTKLAANYRLSVQIASKLPVILTAMPSCVLSPGLADEAPAELEDGGVCNVFYQLFRLFEELLGLNGMENGGGKSCMTAGVGLSAGDRAIVIVAYVALSLKWGRLGYLLKGVKLLLENAQDLNETQFEPLQPLFQELAATQIERPQLAFGEEEQQCGYLMSFGKGDHGKLGHGLCAHVSCQEGNCTENKMVPTMIMATRDIVFRKIDSLSTHSIAITAKGEAMAWGNGDKYRLGHGSSAKEYTPRTIEFLSLKGKVRDLACGLGHTLALMESGELFAWGNGSNGRLGLGDTNDRSSPTRVSIPTISDKQEAGEKELVTDPANTSTSSVRFRHIFCGASHSLGLSWDGRAYAWGKNNQGQCGHGHTNDQWTIQEIESFHDTEEGEEDECIIFAAGGWEHTLFCTASGRVYSCGCGYKDSRRTGIPPVLGHGDCDRRLQPTLVQTLEESREEIVKVACGWDHSLAVSASGRVYTWGSGTNGKLGHGDEESFDIPTLVRTMEGKSVRDAKAGCEHTVFLTHDCELWTCGQGDSGRLGHGDSQTRKHPTKVALFTESGLKPVALAVGDKYNLVLVTNDGCQSAHDNENGPDLVPKAAYRVSEHGLSHGTTVHHGRQRSVLHKKHTDNQQMQFGANWVLGIAAGSDPEGTPATKAPKDGFTPDSAHSVALFIAGHMDRLASDYVAEEEPTSEKLHEPNAIETHSKVQSVLLPFAVDTSCESLSALLRLLQWVTNSTKAKDKSVRAEKYGPDDLSILETQERMGLALSCLRILQLNLKKALDTPHAPGENVDGTEPRSKVSIDLFSCIHELLDSLAGLKEADIVYRFDDNGVRQSRGVNDLPAVAKAISQEAAAALKMGFCMFYPTKLSRCRLLWEILDDCKVDSPSMRTAILSDQLCKDSIMTEIFRSLPSNGLLSLTDHISGDLPNGGATGKDIFAIKSLMILLLKRSGSEAIKQLDNEAFTDFTHRPDCFLRLLHVLQTHYVSIAHQSALQSDKMNGKLDAHKQIMGVLLEYVDSLMAEALTVLKRLHKGSRQHEEIITWRLNGSFFHMVLPSAIECLSVLLQSSTNREGVYRSTQNLVLVERILPNLHVMLKMLDEVIWKMHSAGDVGNQAHHDRVPSTFSHAGQKHNWFIDLGDACAVLCGKLSCELFYHSRMETQDIASRGTYCALVLSEGRLCRKVYEGMSSVKDQISSSARTILEWERLGVFEVEDELVGSEPDASASRSSDSSAVGSHGFLVQFCEIGVSNKVTSFWSWVAASLSHDVEFSAEMQRLLTLVASISAWHLSLVEELQHAYELYDVSTRNSPPTDKISPVPASGVWGMLSALIRTAKQAPWIGNTLDSGAIENAVKTSRLLISVQPNPALIPHILRSEAEELPTNAFRAWDDESLSALLVFLTSSVDVEAVQRFLAVKELNSSLVRTGICVLHDLLRKLTTSSAKSCLLDEFVAGACVPSQISAPIAASMRQITLNQGDDKHISKAIENLFIRLARIISSDDASFELKKKAILAWAIPLGTSKQSAASVVALIAKSGIVSTLVELLLDEVNVPESFTDGKLLSHNLPIGSDPRLSAKLTAIKALMLDQTPGQFISVLAWEAFSAISLQLSRSEPFAQRRADLLLRSAGSSVHEREPLTPRRISLSPRRRLTLPKKTIVSTIDEIIEQMIDGLFLMLKGAKERLEALDNADQDTVKGKEDGMNDTTISCGDLTEEVVSQMQINDTILFRLKEQNMAESTCGQVLRLLCQLVGSSEQASGESSLARISFSDRWITLFTEMLLGTCRDHDVSQVYLCYLLQNVLPRAPPPPDLDIQALGRSLFSNYRSRRKKAVVAELFKALNANDPKQHSSSLSVRRQNDTLCRILQRHGILGGKSCGKILFVSNDAPGETAVDKLTLQMKLTLQFAASVHLIQKLCSTSTWRSRMDVFFAGSTAIFQSIGGFEEALQSPESNSVELEDLRAVISTFAGYSEEAVNCHRALVLDGVVPPLPLQRCSTPFDSVILLSDSNEDQVAQIQGLVFAVMKEGSRQALSLSARKDVLLRCHDDVAAVNAADLKVGSVIHLRARVLRVLMTALLRENSAAPTTNKTCHHFMLENATTCDDLLRAAATYTKEDVAAMLGPDAKIALKLRRVRKFVREVLRGGKRQSGQLPVSVSELEIVQWRLWEEMNTRLTSLRRTPWWQHRSEGNGKVTLEVVGGDVEMCDLKVKALEHFPTVRLAQANICANSGLWFFEVAILTDGLMQIGYVDGEFTADPLQGQGVGDHTNSWAFDGFRCKKWNVSSYDYGEQWKADDVVGVLLDTDRMELSYFLNGKFLGVAFSSIPMTSSSQMCPAASLNVQQSAEFNFGATTPPTNEEGVQMSGGFKHLPALDNIDQARLRPLMSALQTCRLSKSDGGLNTDNLDNEPKDSSDDWGSSNSSDTEDGEIPLEDSINLSDFKRTLVPGSRDGRETRATDQNDEGNSQRRRDLVEGLTGLGFPVEWATRCAAETRLPMNETGAVSWILEQMEKAGLNGAIGLPPTTSTSAEAMEQLSQPSPLGNTRVQLPNLVASGSADESETAGPSLLADASVSNSLEQMSGNAITGIRDNQSGSVFSLPSSSLSEYQDIVSGSINDFLEADKDDQQNNDAASEAFQSGSQRQHLENFNNLLDLFDEPETSATTRALNRKSGVDDLVPLGIAIDTTLYVAYSRQAFKSLLLLALHQEEQGAVYQMVRRLVSSEESSFRFRQFLRLATGLDTIDAVFDVDSSSEGFRSERSLSLQKAITALLHYEAREPVSNKDSLERPPLLDFLCQEMLSQCDRSLNFTRSKHDKDTVDSTSMLVSPAWFAWVCGLVIRFTELRIAEPLRNFDLFPICSSLFLKNLITIAASSSNVSKAWKYVAFRLISRMLCAIRACEGDGTENGTTQSAGTPSGPIVSAQFVNLTELFALRHRREMFNRVFFSDTTSALFNLLVRSVTSSSLAVHTDKQQHCACVSLRVNSYSSTQATISWDQVSRSVSEATESGGMSDDLSVQTNTDIDSSILLLEVKRCCLQMPGYSSDDSINTTLKALPSKGTFTIRNLLPDTQYRLRLAPTRPQNGNCADAVEVLSMDAGLLDDGDVKAAEIILQTPREPVFDLDRESMGKNLVVFNRNLSAKNTVNKKWHSVRASVAFDEGVHQWQVRLDTCVSKNIFIGVCTAEANMENYVGSDAYGYGFLANRAVWHNKAKLHSYGEIFKQGDTIQVTLDCNAKTLAFSRNGEYLGIAASNMRAGVIRSGSSGSNDACKWYPAFSMYNKDDKVTLIPPAAGSTLSLKEGRAQNASTFELIEEMQDVLAYDNQLRNVISSRSLELYEKAFEAFDGWRRQEKIFREIALGQAIVIDTRKAATEKYGLATGDSVFTSKGQCAVLGEYRYELWYEVGEGGSSSLFGASMPQLASWSLSTCREILSSPDEYPVHRHHKYKLELESSDTPESANTDIEQQNQSADPEALGYQVFLDTQERWGDNSVNAADLDATLIAELDAIAMSQACISPLQLSFADISTTLLLEKIYSTHGVSAERGSNQTLARMGLLLHVNRCLYNVVRVALPRNNFATTQGTSEGLNIPAKQLSSTPKTVALGNTECCQVSPVAALMNSPHWALNDPSAFTRMSALAAQLLFSSQKEKLIDEELRRTKTASPASDNLLEPSENEDGDSENDLPTIKMVYPLSRAVPFWELSPKATQNQSFRLPLSPEASVFVQLAKQLAAQDPRQWRRESSQPFEAIPISQAFRVHVESPSTESFGNVSEEPGLEKNTQQQQDEDDEQELQQPSSKQTSKYLNLFESAVRELQSPCFPLFAPVEFSPDHFRVSEHKPRRALELDVNLDLLSASALAHSRLRAPQLLLWYFCFGQLLGIAWRSKVLLPLQYVSKAFWEELVSPADPVPAELGERSKTREVAIRAVREGLFSIIPSRCVALLSGSNPSLREHLSDLDVSYVARLEHHATYTVPSQTYHDAFWKVLHAFTSVERRMLEQFINPERRNGIRQVEVLTSADDTSSIFVLEVADALADGRDHPDSCYPVVVPIGPQSSRLHLPAYSSAQTLRQKLLLAMTNIPFM